MLSSCALHAPGFGRQLVCNVQFSFITVRRNARIASAELATAIPSVRPSVCLSVCPSVTRRYCVNTTARITVQFAPLDSKMCLVFAKPKIIPQGRPISPEILAQSDLPSPEGCEF